MMFAARAAKTAGVNRKSYVIQTPLTKNGPAAATGVGLATIALIVLEDTVAVAEFIRICDYAFEAGNVLRHIEQRLPRNLKHGFAIRLAQQIGFGFWKRLAAFIRIEHRRQAGEKASRHLLSGL